MPGLLLFNGDGVAVGVDGSGGVLQGRTVKLLCSKFLYSCTFALYVVITDVNIETFFFNFEAS